MNRWASIFRTGWRLGVCALLLAWIFHSIFTAEGRRFAEETGIDWSGLGSVGQWKLAWRHGPNELWETLNLVRLVPFLWSLVFMGLTILLGMVRWRLVLREQGIDLSFGRTAEISLVAHFFNSFLLGSTGGDLLKAYYAARETHHRKTEAVVAVVVDRMLGLFTMLVFAGLMMIPNTDLLFAHRRLAALAWFILLMLAGCSAVVVLSFWGGLSRPFPRARAWLRSLPKGELLEKALNASRQYGRRYGFLAKVILLSMTLNVACVLQISALAQGLGLKISPLALLVIVPVIVCISALPITPSGLGVRENLYVLMLAVPEINVDATRALSLSLLAYAGSLIWSVAGGVVYLIGKRTHHLPDMVEPADLAENSGR